MSTPLADQSVGLNTLLIWLGWMSGMSLILLHLFGWLRVGYCGLGLTFVCFAAVREVTGRIYRLECNQQAAFDLGRQAGVRQLRP